MSYTDLRAASVSHNRGEDALSEPWDEVVRLGDLNKLQATPIRKLEEGVQRSRKLEEGNIVARRVGFEQSFLRPSSLLKRALFLLDRSPFTTKSPLPLHNHQYHHKPSFAKPFLLRPPEPTSEPCLLGSHEKP